MFAILEKRVVAGAVAALSLVANLAVFVFLGMVGVQHQDHIRKQNFRYKIEKSKHRQLPLRLRPWFPPSSTPPMSSFSYPGLTTISFSTIFVNCDVFSVAFLSPPSASRTG